ncbi:DUF7564 family protein [Halopelagius longus]|uniref:Small CPxCG-related zinc finger protein n=1 Tax=Halopelagius longus TaxID=1236180 RepID=A0A1H1DP30_9EURY|nr:hypothetical protein [Halopelagius longus]RDI71414.1 hypothetical protein DWB78_06575 [Halopelagius longus]SDQ78284.1 hypothetical protein SAMN05216278_2512 [Halopelagius longus]
MKRTHEPVCVACGTEYSFTGTYKGNYCPDCHEKWVGSPKDDSSRDPSPRPIRKRRTPSVRPIEESDDEEDVPSRYDEE